MGLEASEASAGALTSEQDCVEPFVDRPAGGMGIVGRDAHKQISRAFAVALCSAASTARRPAVHIAR
jgi:hypothetical protein